MNEHVEYIQEINRLADNVLFSLRTNFPVSVYDEQALCVLLEGVNTLELAQGVPSLRELIEFFLDNGDSEAWNLANLLVDVSA